MGRRWPNGHGKLVKNAEVEALEKVAAMLKVFPKSKFFSELHGG